MSELNEADTTIDVLIWEGVNIEGDTVHIWRSASGDYPISFRNDAEGYAGATVIPKEAMDAIKQEVK